MCCPCVSTSSHVYLMLLTPLHVMRSPRVARYKSWTLDSGLDRGLDYGLDYGLDFGLDFRLESRICKLTSRFQAFPPSTCSLVPKVVIIQIPMDFVSIQWGYVSLDNALRDRARG